MWISCYTVELEILPRTTITSWQSIQRERQTLVQSMSGLTSFSRKDNGEFGTSRKLVGTSVRLVGGEWKIHYVRRTRDVAGRNRKHQDRVKRKGTR